MLEICEPLKRKQGLIGRKEAQKRISSRKQKKNMYILDKNAWAKMKLISLV